MFRPYYRAAARMGFDPSVIDDMELWQIGATFTPTEEEEKQLAEQQRDEKGRPVHSTRHKKRDLVAERLAYAEGRGPKPEPDAPSGDVEVFLGKHAQLNKPREG